MKRILFIIILLSTFNIQLSTCQAQIARWIVSPQYDNIHLAQGADVIITHLGEEKSAWDMEGNKLFSTGDMLFSFKDDRALTVKNGTSLITMIYKANGEKLSLDNCHTAYSYPYYSDGMLLVHQGAYYRFVDKDGKLFDGKYINAYPYFNGYAMCNTYRNLEKRKDPYRLLIDHDGQKCVFSYLQKTYDDDDIDFISSVNDENIGVVVIKEKMYFFNGIDKKISPVFIDEQEHPIKEQAKLTTDIEQDFVMNSDSLFYLTGKCGKAGIVTFVFDHMLKPLSITRNDVEYTYHVNMPKEKNVESDLEVFKGDNSLSLHWKGIGEVLPPQFDTVIQCFDNKAIVIVNDKMGVVGVNKDESYRLKINKGNDIAFRHQKYETTIRADFPTYIQSDKLSIEVAQQSGCDIDKTSKEYKNTESGNYVQYNCVLNIPQDLPDELTTIEYPVTIVYDGIKSTTIPFAVNAWHYKYFVVDPDESQTTIENGTVSFVFNINADRIASDGIYPTTVNIITDSLTYEYEKLSETRHKCKVYSLHEGTNNIAVQIIEQGCPPATFPFEIDYQRPVAKSKNHPAEKEKVTIKKKTRKVEPKPANKPQNHIRVLGD